MQIPEDITVTGLVSASIVIMLEIIKSLSSIIKDKINDNDSIKNSEDKLKKLISELKVLIEDVIKTDVTNQKDLIKILEKMVEILHNIDKCQDKMLYLLERQNRDD